MKRLLILLLCLPLLAFSQEEIRLALVIGNTDYDGNMRLPNAVSDAKLIAKTLDSIGFETTLCLNVTKDELEKAVDEFFALRYSLNPKVTFIYYSGHGAQLNHENYLIPIKAEIPCVDKVHRNGFQVEEIIQGFRETSEGNSNILVLDACRNNPYPSCRKSKSGGSNEILGLARIPPTQGILIAFSTDPNEVAWDGELENSSYAFNLSKYLLEKDLEIRKVFEKVRIEVEKIEGDQSPDMRNKLRGDLYLVKSTYEKEFDLIDSLLEIGDNKYLTESMGIVSDILGKQPENPRALHAKGEIFLRLDDYEKALRFSKKIIKLFPNDPYSFYYRGWIYLNKTKQYEKAIAEFNQCIEIDSTYLSAYEERAECHFILKDHKKALADYTQSIKLDEENPERYYNRANYYISMKDSTNALKDYEKAIILSPENPKYLLKRVRFYSDQGKYDLALKDVTDAIQIDSSSILAYNLLGYISISKIKDYDNALIAYNKVIEIDDKNTYAYSQRAKIYETRREYENAIADYTKAIELDKENPERYDERAYCYVEMAPYGASMANEYMTLALKDYDKAISLAPENPYYYNNRGDLYSDFPVYYDRSLEDYATVIKISNNDWQTYRAIHNRANIYSIQEKYELAIEEYTKGIVIVPNSPLVYVNRAFTYEKLEKHEDALADFTQAIKLDSLEWTYYNHRAECYDNLNDYNNSQMDWTMAINLAPEDEFDWQNYEFRAYSYMRNEKYELAIADFTNIITGHNTGTDPYWYNIRGRMYLHMGEYNKAEKDFTTSIEYTGTDYVKIEGNNWNTAEKWQDYFDVMAPGAYNHRAKLYSLLGEYEKEKADYLEAIKLDEENAESHYYLALFYIRENMTIKALSYFSSAIQYFESSRIFTYNIWDEKVDLPDIYHKRAELYSKEGYPELMCDDYKKACDLGDCEMFNTNCK